MSNNTERTEIDYAKEWVENLPIKQQNEISVEYNLHDYSNDHEHLSAYRKEVINPWWDEKLVSEKREIIQRHLEFQTLPIPERNFEFYRREALEKQTNPEMCAIKDIKPPKYEDNGNVCQCTEECKREKSTRIELESVPGASATFTGNPSPELLGAVEYMAKKAYDMHHTPESILEKSINESVKSNVYYSKSSCKEFYGEAILKAMQEFANQEKASLLEEVEALRMKIVRLTNIELESIEDYGYNNAMSDVNHLFSEFSKTQNKVK